jgi:hypothetical protein
MDKIKNYLKSFRNLLVSTKGRINTKRKSITSHPDFRYVLILVILGFTPLIWYKTGHIALGHDMGFPLDPISWFRDRVWTWNERNNFGQDQSVIMGSVILHGFEALLHLITGSVYLAQKASYVFWFMLTGMSMYIFLRNVVDHKQKRLISLFGGMLYMYNLFFLQGWFIAERNKFAILSALPLVVLLIVKVLRDKYNFVKASVLISLIYLLFNGGGSLPLFGSTIITLGLAFTIFSVAYIRSIKQFFRAVGFAILGGVCFLLANSFWLFPQVFVIKNSFSLGLEGAGGIESTKRWIQEISLNANYSNLLRMEGFPDWSQNHVYAPFYLNNPLLIILSCFFLFSLFYAVKGAKTRNLKVLLTFALAVLIGNTIFAAGSNGLFGGMYLWMVEHVPLFVVFRTPFYKFAGGIVFAYCFLFSLGAVTFIEEATNFYRKKRKSAPSDHVEKMYFFQTRFYKLLTGVMLMVYAFPYLTGSFFDWNKPVTTMVKVPEYVFDYGKYANVEYEKKGKTLLVPDLGAGNAVDTTDWNYFSLDNVPSLVSNKPNVTGTAGSAYVDQSEKLIRILYENLYENKNHAVSLRLMELFNIDNILLRNDSIKFKGVDIVDPIKWKESLENNPFLNLELSLDKWDLYSVKVSEKNYGTDKDLTILSGPIEDFADLINVSSINFIDSPSLIVEGEKSLNKDIPAKIRDSAISKREIISLNKKIDEINDGKIKYTIDAQLSNYSVVTKSFRVDELLYNLYARKSEEGYIITIERPNAEIDVNGQKLSTLNKSQDIKIDTKKAFDKLVINGKVFNVPLNIGFEKVLIDQFQPGSNQISISYGLSTEFVKSKDILKDPSFEAGSWGGVQICGGVLSPKNIDAKKTTDRVNGKFGLELKSEDRTIACLIQKLSNLDKGKIYQLEFDYKNVSGYPIRYCILKRNLVGSQASDDGCLAGATVSKSPIWSKYSTIFVPSNASEHIFHFYSESEKDSISKNLIDNVQFSEITTTNYGAYSLDTGIEKSQFFNLESTLFEDIGNAKLDRKNTVQVSLKNTFLQPELIEDGDFEEKLWGGVNLCGGDPKSTEIRASKFDQDKTSGEFSAKLEAENGTACIYNSIQNFRPSLKYKVSFDYKNIAGNAPQFCALVRDGKSSECKPNVTLEKAKDWTRFTTTIDTTSITQDVILHLYSPAKLGEKSINLFDNLKVEAVYNPLEKIFFISDFDKPISTKPADINLTKINPTKYTVSVKNMKTPEVVTIKTAYSPFWRIKKVDNTLSGEVKDTLASMKSVFTTGKFDAPFEHFHTNGFANSWLVGEDGEYEIEYLPQRVFYFGLTISIFYISLIISSIFIYKTFTVTRRRFRKKSI